MVSIFAPTSGFLHYSTSEGLSNVVNYIKRTALWVYIFYKRVFCEEQIKRDLNVKGKVNLKITKFLK
jgi:hypothetical protein